MAIDSLTGAAIMLARALDGHADVLAEGDPVRERVTALELSREIHEAQVEALILSAESKFKAARASEERQRVVSRANGDLESDDESEDLLAAFRDFVASSHVEGGEGEGLPDVHPEVATDGEVWRTQALRAKYAG